MRIQVWFSLLLLLLPAAAAAQTTLRVPVSADRSLSNVEGASIPLAGGGSLLAVEFDGPATLSGRLVDGHNEYGNTLLARVDPGGRPLWHRVLHSSNRSTHVSAMLPTPDGGAVVAGHLPQPAVLSIGPDGRERWRLPILENNGTYLNLASTPRGTVIVRGTYYRGPVRIPGQPTFPGPRRFNSFLAEVDLQGQVQWARRVPGDALAYLVVSADGTLTTAGQFRDPFRHGRRVLRSNGDWDIAVQRFGPRGQPLGAFTFGGSGADTLSGLHVYGSGEIALLTAQPPPQGITRQQQLVGLDPSGHVLFSRTLAGRSAKIAEGAPGPLAVVVQPIGEERLAHAPEVPRDRPELGPVSRSESLYARSMRVLQVDARGGETALSTIAPPGYAMDYDLGGVRRHGGEVHIGSAMAPVRPDGRLGTMEAVSFIRPLSPAAGPAQHAGLAPPTDEVVRW